MTSLVGRGRGRGRGGVFGSGFVVEHELEAADGAEEGAEPPGTVNGSSSARSIMLALAGGADGTSFFAFFTFRALLGSPTFSTFLFWLGPVKYHKEWEQ